MKVEFTNSASQKKNKNKVNEIQTSTSLSVVSMSHRAEAFATRLH